MVAPFRGEPVSCARTFRRCALVADGAGTWAAPGAILLEGTTVIAAGDPRTVPAPGDAAIIDDPTGVVMPATVNAHSHLDLTHIGAAAPHADAFIDWIDAVRAARHEDPGAIAASVAAGVELALAGGTAAVGDIAGAATPEGDSPAAQALDASPLSGVAFVEVFGRGASSAGAVERIRRAVPVAGRIPRGWEPHAPYSCAREVFAAAAASDRPVATHLAETPAELEFLARGTGAFAEFLARLGLADRGAASGAHPIAWLGDLLDRPRAPWLIAHLNYLDGLDPAWLERLAAWNATVAYCPRAHAYFGHRAHPWPALRSAGVRVALGTDGLPCLDTPDRIGVIDDARLLHRRDGIGAPDLVAMMTVAGAAALGIEPDRVTLAPGPTLGVLRLEAGPENGEDPFVRALHRADAPTWIAGP